MSSSDLDNFNFYQICKNISKRIYFLGIGDSCLNVKFPIDSMRSLYIIVIP